MRRVPAAKLLTIAGAAAIGCGAVALLVEGAAGGAALILIGLFNSVMYSTIYVLAIPSEPHLAILGSTILSMAVVVGAIVPFVTGLAADSVGLSTALVVPVACYAAVLWFGVTHQRTAPGQGECSCRTREGLTLADQRAVAGRGVTFCPSTPG